MFILGLGLRVWGAELVGFGLGLRVARLSELPITSSCPHTLALKKRIQVY